MRIQDDCDGQSLADQDQILDTLNTTVFSPHRDPPTYVERF